MGVLSGAKAYNTGNEVRDRQLQDATMNAAAQSYSNYRIQQARARQSALENMMSLYNGPNQALAGISGGRGADLSRVSNNPFAAASPGYFNVGRAAPATQNYDTGAGWVSPSVLTDTNGSATAVSKGRWAAPGEAHPNGMAVNPMPYAYVNQSANGQAPPPVRPAAGNPFAYNPGGRR